MDSAGVDQRFDDERLLSQCIGAGGVNSGSFGELPVSIDAIQRRSSWPSCSDWPARVVLPPHLLRFVSHFSLQVYHVWRGFSMRISPCSSLCVAVPGGYL